MRYVTGLPDVLLSTDQKGTEGGHPGEMSAGPQDDDAQPLMQAAGSSGRPGGMASFRNSRKVETREPSKRREGWRVGATSSAIGYLHDALCPMVEHAPLTVDTLDGDPCIATLLLHLQSRVDCVSKRIEAACEF